MAARGRPPLTIGTYGRITVLPEDGPGPYVARSRFRDTDGVVRDVRRFGETKGRAERALKAALVERQKAAAGMSGATRVAELAAAWLADVDSSSRSIGTRTQYRNAVGRYIIPRLGGLRISEVDTTRCEEALKAIRGASGPGAAKSARAVLNGMMGHAVRQGAAAVNPVRETSPIGGKRSLARALTTDEATDMCDKLRSDERAMAVDLPDLVEFMLATGVRIGEATAVRKYNARGDQVLDLDAGTVEIDATAIRVRGAGLWIQERPKTAAGWRVLALPPFAVSMLRQRIEDMTAPPQVMSSPVRVDVIDGNGGELRGQYVGVVAFPAVRVNALRDPSNTQADIREVLARLGYGWVTSHTFRKSVATRLDEAGFTPRQIADQLGHSQPSMTQDVYMGRRVVSTRAAEVLDR